MWLFFFVFVMICLGIESTAHTFGVGVVDGDGVVLSNVRKQYTTVSGGIVPNDASSHHVDVCDVAIREALSLAGLGSVGDVDLVAFSQGPGIGHCLRVGAVVARVLALKWGVRVVGVNHCVAHLEIGRVLTGCVDPVLLYVSGANTQVIGFSGGRYRVFGETLDVGVGNFLDVFARELKLGFPGGPKVERLAESGVFFELPYSVKGMDVSFSGLLTHVSNKLKISEEFSREDFCKSVQETVFAMVLEVAERALAYSGKGELLLGGGVACNRRLQEMALSMCEDRGVELFVPDKEVLLDNGAMIAWLGVVEFNRGNFCKGVDDIFIRPYWRVDED